jgi:hypothetical protein
MVLRILNEELTEIEGSVISGSLLLHDTADKIAVDYAHKVGIVEGFSKALQMMKTIDDLTKDGEIDERV